MKKKHIFIIVFLSFLFFWCIYCFLPLVNYNSPERGQIKIFDRYNTLITHIPRKDGFFIPISKETLIPQKFSSMLLASEDKRFFSHFGIDIIAKIRALLTNIQTKSIISGGSTITEQWIKNAFFPKQKRTILQKLRETTLAFYFSQKYTKQEILHNYLNSLYFGNHIYGIQAASLVYFEKQDLESLNEQEILVLLALLQSPSALTSNEKYFQQTYTTLFKKLKKLSLVESDFQIPSYQFSAFSAINKNPHVTQSILEELKEKKLYNQANLVIESTIDTDLQNNTKQIIENSLELLLENNVSNAAAYVFNPKSGDILVWQGSKDFYSKDIDGQVNIINQKQQIGSAMKPFVYLYGFLNGAHPDNLIVDLEKDFYKENKDTIFRPLNYNLIEGGVITLKKALAGSFNISAVRLIEHLGLENTYNFLKDLDIHLDFPSKHYGLSLALGSPDVSMKNIAETYGVLATGGTKNQTSLIKTVNGKKLKKETKLLLENNTKNQIALFHLFSTLSSQDNRSITFGLNSILNTSIPFAVKTGTTKNFRDNWTFGYRPDFVVAVWVGNNDNSSMVNVSGITGAAPIWHRITELAIKKNYIKSKPYPIPKELKTVTKCLDRDCFQKETIYQSDEKKWLSDFSEGNYCLEDFFIQNIDEEEILKIAKLFHFSSFSIHSCNTEEKISSENPQIIKPSNGEIFYIKKNTPIELQKIIIQSNKSSQWIINGKKEEKEIKTIFVIPKEGKNTVKIPQNESIEFWVKFVE